MNSRTSLLKPGGSKKDDDLSSSTGVRIVAPTKSYYWWCTNDAKDDEEARGLICSLNFLLLFFNKTKNKKKQNHVTQLILLLLVFVGAPVLSWSYFPYLSTILREGKFVLQQEAQQQVLVLEQGAMKENNVTSQGGAKQEERILPPPTEEEIESRKVNTTKTFLTLAEEAAKKEKLQSEFSYSLKVEKVDVSVSKEQREKIKLETTEYANAARKRGSSLRFDWGDLPPMTELGKWIDGVQSKCLVAAPASNNFVRFGFIGNGLVYTFVVACSLFRHEEWIHPFNQ